MQGVVFNNGIKVVVATLGIVLFPENVAMSENIFGCYDWEGSVYWLLEVRVQRCSPLQQRITQCNMSVMPRKETL